MWDCRCRCRSDLRVHVAGSCRAAAGIGVPSRVAHVQAARRPAAGKRTCFIEGTELRDKSRQLACLPRLLIVLDMGVAPFAGSLRLVKWPLGGTINPARCCLKWVSSLLRRLTHRSPQPFQSPPPIPLIPSSPTLPLPPRYRWRPRELATLIY